MPKKKFETGYEPQTQLVPSEYFSVVRAAHFAQLLGVCRASLYSRLNPKSKYFDARAPKRVKLGKRAVGFYLGEVLEYIQSLGREH